ncbi:sugar phosphate isomerase/epimerase [Salegentibacter sp. JZCK2]|uniref:sugar phosphate isomerase/epimerase family protein n=1 Tax=Salegentibacter tibetensis TaxID=2873600 RepID=UPI001CCF0245|nr:sugar phosphate isomerase/epimerase family protein [Salegentibacter tibetensis]MBZ9729332.1 sugar phosphate isomerase/epimerase [Salegentibacter tibetensis]
MKITPTKVSSLLLILFLSFGIYSCKDQKSENKNSEISQIQAGENAEPFFKLSLAQWSLNKPIYAGELDPMDFAETASEMGFEGIEYVSGFYGQQIKEAENPEKAMQKVLDTLKAKSEEFNVENVLIMVDGEGELASPNQAERKKAVENHKKWVDAANFLGAHSIRVNLFGSEESEEWKASATKGLKALSEYAAEKNVNVLVENHGYLSSDAALLVDVIEEVNMENCGTLPDFGNFCLKREDGERWEAKCVEEYPKYQGIEEMMPHAKAVSAKSYNFNEEGEETTLDYERILKIVQDAGYTGFVGVEYEGENLSPEEGIEATRELLIEVGSKLNSTSN